MGKRKGGGTGRIGIKKRKIGERKMRRKGDGTGRTGEKRKTGRRGVEGEAGERKNMIEGIK
jgi:hypothetical protein